MFNCQITRPGCPKCSTKRSVISTRFQDSIPRRVSMARGKRSPNLTCICSSHGGNVEPANHLCPIWGFTGRRGSRCAMLAPSSHQGMTARLSSLHASVFRVDSLWGLTAGVVQRFVSFGKPDRQSRVGRTECTSALLLQAPWLLAGTGREAFATVPGCLSVTV